MEVYKNSFDKNEDMMLWELHEIRHELHIEITQKSVEQINREALKKYSDWREERDLRKVA